MSVNQEMVKRAQQVITQNYSRQPLVMSRGQGSWVWDADGRRYLDLFAGFGGGILGHAHPALAETVARQAHTLWHVGNVFYNKPQVDFAERLGQTAFPGMAFFCHSGAEANEAACKLARLRGVAVKPDKWKIIALQKSFHGRTLAMIAATGNPAVRNGFGPEVPGFVHVPAGDFDALAAAVDDQTCGIIMEPIQGEGGINLYPDDYAAKVRDLCNQRNITLIFDEVWTGCGRTGRWFGHQHLLDADGNVVIPDIMTLGKAVGGGLPVGVMWARPEIAAMLTPGKHGCTLGGNAICMAAASTIFDVIEEERLLDHAQKLGDLAMQTLKSDRRIQPYVQEVRGKGLFIGIELKNPPVKFLENGLERGVMLNVTAQKVIRLAPPINIGHADWKSGLELTVQTILASQGA